MMPGENILSAVFLIIFGFAFYGVYQAVLWIFQVAGLL